MSNNEKPLKIYTASAGSGKTFTLVREYLTLCLGKNADAYKEILAVTFTNKAANEMKAKILKFLLGIIEGSNKDEIVLMKNFIIEKTGTDEKTIIERCKTVYTNILHNYSDMAVTTIDSFVQRLSRSFARELGLPSQYSVMLDNDDLVDEILQLLSDEIGDNKFITNVLSQYIEYNLSEEKSANIKGLLRKFIMGLLKEDAYKKGEKKSVVDIDEAKYKEIKSSIHDELQSVEKSIDKIINDLRNEENRLGISVDDYARKSIGLPSIITKMEKRNIKLTTDTTDKILNEDSDWKNSKSKIVGDDMLRCYQEAVKKYKLQISKKQTLTFIEKDLYLYVLRNHIFELINKYIEESSQVHISEFNKRISDALGDCSVPFIYERIGEKYKHFFIDEFQDTSVLQWQNFLPLIDNSLAQRNMNLIVGDAKQSIYRFRSGEVEQIINLPKIYKKPDNEFGNNCENQFIESADNQTLDTNFRSRKNVIKFNNTFFEFAKNYLDSPESDDKFSHVFDNGKQKYNNKDNGFVSVEVFSGDLDNKEYHEKVLQSMHAKIEELHSKGIDYKDITIQVRTRNEGTEIANYLSEKGIEVISADSVKLMTSDKVQLIISTLQYFVNDTIPVTVKTLSYFYEKTHEGKKLPLIFIDKYTIKLDETFVNELQNIHNQAYSIYDLCVQLCKYYGFNILEDVFLQYFMNMLFDWQSCHSTGIDSFVEFWDKKKSELTIQITGELNCVNIMTIHKSKGLEFKVVMYPFAQTKLESANHNDAKKLWVECAKNEYLEKIPYLDAFLLPLTKTDLVGTTYEPELVHEQQKTKLDTLNMIYVSMTRAREMLYVFTKGNKSEGKDKKENIFCDFFDQPINKGVDSQYDYFIRMSDIQQEDGQDSKIYSYGCWDDSYKKSESKDEEKLDILELNENVKASNSLNWFDKLSIDLNPTMIAEKSTSQEEAEAWGTLVHEIFAKITTKNDIDRVLLAYVNNGSINNEQSEKLKKKFVEVADNEYLRAAYSPDAIVMNEMDIHTPTGTVKRPDRYAVTKNDTILIDYKTGKPYKKYYEQLKEYVAVLKQMNDNQEIKAYLVYINEEVRIEEVR